MKSLSNFISWIYIIGTIILGIFLIISVSGWFGIGESAGLFVDRQINSPAGIWTGIILLFSGMLFLFIRFRADKKQRTISFDTPEGEVTISVKAIEDFIRRVGKEFHDITEITPVVVPCAGGIKIKARTSITAGTNVPKTAEGIQHTIKSRVQDILGIENITMVEVNISKLTANTAREPAPGAEHQPF